MFQKITTHFILFDLFVAVVFYILALALGVLLKKNHYLIVPFLFGLMYGNYILQVL